MKSSSLLCALAGWLWTLGWPAAAQNSEVQIPPPELERFVDGVVMGGMASDHVAGVTVAIVQDGRVVLIKGYGMAAPGQSVDPRRDLFRVGSISKTFTWIALMQQVERGQIRLDAPVNDYLPPALKIPDQGFQHPIRIRDLMSHSAGFEVAERGHLTVEQSERVISLEQELRLHRPDRVREPQILSSYSNYGASLAGRVAAAAYGGGFEHLIEQEITGPLGMTRTTFREPYRPREGLPVPMSADLARNLAVGFDWKGGSFQPAAFEFVGGNGPAGAVSTTAADMSRYMLMQLGGGVLNGQRIYGPMTARAFRTPLLSTPRGVNGWAHGFMVRPLPGGYLSYGHGGSMERFYSNLSLVPDLRLGVFISTNTSTGRRLAESLPKLIVERFYAPGSVRPRRPGVPGFVKQADLYGGRYVTTRRAYGGLEGFLDLLQSHDRVSVTSQGYLKTRLGGEVRFWVPDGAPGHFIDADGTETLVFTRDGKGRAIRFPFPRGTYSAERVGPLLNERLFALAAGLALAAATGTWGAALLRGKGGGRLRLADLIGLAVAGLWLLAFTAFWRSGLLHDQAVGPESGFPGALLLTASWAALLAAVGSPILLVAWLSNLRNPEAGGWRSVGQGAALAAFLLFALLVAIRGGLTPWA